MWPSGFFCSLNGDDIIGTSYGLLLFVKAEPGNLIHPEPKGSKQVGHDRTSEGR